MRAKREQQRAMLGYVRAQGSVREEELSRVWATRLLGLPAIQAKRGETATSSISGKRRGCRALLTLALCAWASSTPSAYAVNYVVNSLADDTTSDGRCTLREAMLAANDAPPNGDCGAGSSDEDIITFSVTGTIRLGSTLPEVPAGVGALTIDGGGGITVSGENRVGVMVVLAGAEVSVRELTITRGFVDVSLMQPRAAAGIFNLGTLNVTNTTFSQHRGSGLGAIYTSGTLHVTNSAFLNNEGATGGAIVQDHGSMTISGSTFADNHGLPYGGAIMIQGTATIVDTVFYGNSAYYGGALLTGGGMVSVTNSTFMNNTAFLGGAICNFAALLTVVNTTVANNRSDYGGGIAAWRPGVILANSTVVGNGSAVIGGGIWAPEAVGLVLNNNIIAGSSGGGDCVGPATASSKNNLIQDRIKTCGLANGVNGNIVGVDPGLGSLTGSPPYFLLQPNSPAIDGGDNETCAAAPVSNQSQNGVVRPQDGDGDGVAVCDIGSYEAPGDGVAIPTETRTPSPTATATPSRTFTATRSPSPRMDDADSDGLPDSWELLHFGHTRFGPSDDPDGDGFPNDEELEDETNPKGPDLVIEDIGVSISSGPVRGCGSVLETTPGATLRLRYVVFNPHSRPATVRLGASLCLPVGQTCGVSSGDLFFNDPSNDDLLELAPGRSTPVRSFQLLRRQAAGQYSVVVSLLSKRKTRQLSISQLKCDGIVRVQQPREPSFPTLLAVKVDPPQQRLGKSITLTFTLMNKDPDADAVVKLRGLIRPTGTAEWIRSGPSRASLPAGTTGSYPVTMEIPTDAALGWYDVGWQLLDERETAVASVVRERVLNVILPLDAADTDEDKLPDKWELQFFGNLSGTGSEDPDGDGLDNWNEFLRGTNPTSRDSDGDGVTDGDEVAQGRDPLRPEDDSNPQPPSPEVGALVFVPGIAGTELKRGSDTWPPSIIGALVDWCDQNLVQAFQLQKCGLDDCTRTQNSVEVRGIIGSVYGDFVGFLKKGSSRRAWRMQDALLVEEEYADFSRFLEGVASSQGMAFLPLPYDWRLQIDWGPDNPADKLGELIRPYCTQRKRVDIVAHSMGGLVAKAYLAKKRDNERCVRNLITLGTPHYGATKMLKMLLFGEDDIVGWYQFMFDKDAFADLLKNAPSAYQLLPSKGFFNQLGESALITQMNRWYELDSQANLKALTYREFLNFLANQKNEWTHTYCFVRKRVPLNAQLLEWVGRHDVWDGWAPEDPELTAYYFAGTGVRTLKSLVYREKCFWPFCWWTTEERRDERGDGTVLEGSALAKGVESPRIKRASFQSGVFCPAAYLKHPICPTAVVFKDYSHVGMLGEEDLRDAIRCILRGGESCIPISAGTSLVLGQSSEPGATQEQEEPGVWLEATLFSEALDLHVFDASENHTGPVNGGVAEREIPLSQYSDYGTTEVAIVPYGRTYIVEVRAPAGGVGELTLRRYRGSRPEVMQRYSPISLPTGGVSRLVVTELNEEVVLETDEEANGNVEQIQAPARPPVADAGENVIAEEGSAVVLEGTGHLGSGAGPLSYLWTQISGPPVVLSDPSSPRLEFVLPGVNGDQAVLLQLVVNDGESESEPDWVSVTILDTAPQTPTATPSATETPSSTPVPSPTPTTTASKTPTATATVPPPTFTRTPTATVTFTLTRTPTFTASATFSLIATVTRTPSGTLTLTPTPTPTSSASPTPTWTESSERCPQADLGSSVPVVVSGDTSGRQNSLGGASCGLGGDSAPDYAYQWAAPSAGVYTIDTLGSSFDTVLYVRGGSCSGVELACNDDAQGTWESQVTLALQAGQVIVVVVDGFGGQRGVYTLRIGVDRGTAPTFTLTHTPTPSQSLPTMSTNTATRIPSPTTTATDSPTPTPSHTHTFTATRTDTATPTQSWTPIFTRTPTPRFSPTHTRSPTRTRTSRPEPTFSRTPTSTPTRTLTPRGGICRNPQPLPSPPAVYVEQLVVEELGDATVTIKLRTGGRQIAGVQNDLLFDTTVRVKARANGEPDCSANPEIHKPATSFRFWPPGCTGQACTGLRAVVVAADNVDPIPHGSVLYTCNVTVHGSGTLAVVKASAGDATGARVAGFSGHSGTICLAGEAVWYATRTPTPTVLPCVGDCNRDARVTIDELVAMVNVAMGISEVSRCSPGDANEDGTITVEEIVAAVNRALGGC